MNDEIDAILNDVSLVLGAPSRQGGAIRAQLTAMTDGKTVPLEFAIARAKQLIESSTAPAIVGLNGLTLEAVREAVALAERHRMKLLPMPLPDPIAARQTVMQTATLGHAMAADLQVKRESTARLAIDPPPAPPWEGGESEVTPDDLADRIDAFITARVPNALFMPVDDLDAVLALRTKVRELGAKVFTDATALPVKRVIVLLPHDCDPRAVSQWHRLAVEVQQELRLAVLSLPSPDAGNIRGVLEVITWQTGLSCATGGVDFTDGSPRPCAGAVSLLARGAIDLVIDTGLRALPDALSNKVTHRIRIGPEPDAKAAVSFVTPGLSLGLAAQVMRFDGVMLWLGDDATGAQSDPAVELLRRIADDESPAGRARH
ncbi:MAG: hypothetical protein WD768_22080 [Phycisphaeraceae bacterium]